MSAADVDALQVALTRDLAEWFETTFMPASGARSFYRRLRLLVGLKGRTRAEVMSELNAGARRLLEEQLTGR